ncbi:hypothetical protein [Paracoccus alkanivorans]|uniref:hypothetical protein n=1 Tax=Paracoccus alkanivorans TaxID=2116655 RepID=UPI001409715C|nr:hypothetical protein [Paracoccus alkanivorans]
MLKDEILRESPFISNKSPPTASALAELLTPTEPPPATIIDFPIACAGKRSGLPAAPSGNRYQFALAFLTNHTILLA